ncbi:MAG: 6-bladed beta-propeller [Bacteroidetes bacterium]|nr:6-bladed beta-propeller [Bacteroidota bacterium]MCY4205544.1 6-bladed beta-propeller [Bacteroidota bacterium]
MSENLEKEFRELWSIGKNSDDVLFGKINSVSVDSKGRVYVSDWDHSSIYVFSEEGELITEIGRRGEGPGEFIRIGELFVGQGDSLFVHDRQNNIVSLFTPIDYKFVRRVRFPFLDSYAPYRFIGVTDEGFVVSYTAFLEDGADNQLNRINPVYMIDRSTGLLIRTSPITTVKNLGSMVISSRDGAHSMINNPFHVYPMMRISTQEKMYFAQGDTRSISVYNKSGAFGDSLTWEHDLIPFTSNEIRDTLKEYSRRWRRHMQKIGVPDFKPAIQTFVVDDLGHVWIQLSSAKGESLSTWIILNQAGVELGVMKLPINVRLTVIRNGKSVGILKSKNGADILISHAIQQSYKLR